MIQHLAHIAFIIIAPIILLIWIMSFVFANLYIVLIYTFTIILNLFSAKGLEPVAEKILSYLDAKSLRAAELVCKEWRRVIADGMLWKKLIHRKVRHDPLWKGLGERRGWLVLCFVIALFDSDSLLLWIAKIIILQR